eukprot:6491352-Amphidinium_carterae.3
MVEARHDLANLESIEALQSIHNDIPAPINEECVQYYRPSTQRGRRIKRAMQQHPSPIPVDM